MTVPAIVTISLALSLTIGESALAQSNSKDEQAIRKVILDGIKGFNRHDAKAGTVFFAEDADFVTVYGTWSMGAAEIERSRTERFQTALKEAKIKLLDLRVRFIKPDVAIAHEIPRAQRDGKLRRGEGAATTGTKHPCLGEEAR